MTPLAFRMAKDLTLPIKRRRACDDFALATAKKLGGAHCFDVTAAWPVIEDLAIKIAYDGHDVGPLGFLPAEKTWIEYDDSAYAPEKYFYGRVGFLLESKAGGRFADITWCSECGDYTDEQLRLMSNGKDDIGRVKWAYQAGNDDQLLYLFHDANSRVHWTGPDVGPDITDPDERDAIANWEPGVIFAALALINSPRIIGRRQHMPHRGLERDLIAKKKLIGKFPLHAWTEIKLEINSARGVSADASTEAHLTGERALHFCRAHLRIRLGKLELVSAHWRGNPALGIKRSRYRLMAPDVEART